MFTRRAVYETVFTDQMNYCILGYYDHIADEELDVEFISSIIFGNEPIMGYRATYQGRHLLEDCKLIRQIKALSKLAVDQHGTGENMFDFIKDHAPVELSVYMDSLHAGERVQFIRERLYCIKFFAEYTID